MKQFAHHSFRLLALLVCAICASSSRADLLTYEGFNYYPNTLESGNAGTNWTTTWGQFSSNSGRFFDIAGGSLVGGALSTSSNSVFSSGGKTDRYFLSPGNWGAGGTSAYFSFLIRPNVTPATNQYYGLDIYSDNNNTGNGVDLFVGKPGSSVNWGLEAGAGNDALSAVSAALTQTVFLVVRVDFYTGVPDVFKLYVNPSPGGSEPAAPDAVLTNDIGFQNGVALNVGNGGVAGFDELRIGSTFASVTPTSSVSDSNLIAYEPFEYDATIGNVLSGLPVNGTQDSNGWDNVSWGDGGLGALSSYISAGNLADPSGLLVTCGNKVATWGDYAGRWNYFPGYGSSVTTAYFSILIQPECTPTTNNYYGLQLFSNSGQGDLFVGKNAAATGTSNLFWGLEHVASGAAYGTDIYSGVACTISQTVFLVVRGDYGAGMDTFRLYVNPTPGASEPTNANATVSYNIGTQNGLEMRTGDNSGIPCQTSYDEIRIGTNYADVTPWSLTQDSVGDGIPDWWRAEYYGNPTTTNQYACASCVDTNPWAHGLTNIQVYQNPSVLTADGYSTLSDGIPDWWKVKYGLSLTDPAVASGDLVGDGVSNLYKYLHGLDPTKPTCTFTGPTTVCALSASNTYSTTAGMSSYSWAILGDSTLEGSSTQQTVYVDAGSSDSFTVVASLTGTNGGVSACTNTVSINQPPAITSSPANLSLCAGNPATFTIAATGAGLQYTWRKGGAGWGGLGPWILSTTTNDSSENGFFVGASYTLWILRSPNIIDMGGRAWGLYATNGQTAAAVRSFNGAVPVGEAFMIDMANGWINTGGVDGFGLQDANGTNRFEFYFVSGQMDYFINDGNNPTRGGPMDTGAPYTAYGIHLKFTLTGSDGYAFTILYQDGTSVTTNGVLEGISGSGIAQVRLFEVGEGAGGDYNLYFNNLRVDGKSDNAGDAVYNDGWQTGDGGGWELDGSTNGGSNNYGWFIGSSTNNGGGDPGDDGKIDTAGGKSWGLWANSGGLSEARRLFNGPMVTGDTVRVAFDNGWIQSGSSVSFGLQDSTGTNRFEFSFTGGNSHYFIHDSTGLTRDSGVSWTDQGLLVAFTLTGADTYSVVVSAVNSNTYGIGNTGPLPVTVTGTLAGTPGSLIDRLGLFNNNAGSGPQYDAFFNSVSIGSKSDNASDPAYATGWNTGTDGGQSLNGIDSSNFSIASARFADGGVYDVVVTGACGSAVTSTPAAMMIPTPASISGPSALNVQCTAVYSAPWEANMAYDWSVSSNAAILSDFTEGRTIMIQALDTNSLTVALAVTNGDCVSVATNTMLVQNQPGLIGEYYADQYFGDLAFIRLDPSIDFDWSGSSPSPGIIPPLHYSIRWTGQFQAAYSESYTFTTISDDGVRLWVGDQLLIDNWTDHSATTNTATINLTAGQTYNLQLEYYQDFVNALIHLFWSSAHQSQQVMPFVEPVVWDSIAGLPNPLAAALGISGPNTAAASGTVSMAEQVFQTLNNPLTNDLDGTVSDVVVVNGSQTNNALGQWQVLGNEIYAIDRRGYVEYQMTVPATNVYRLTLVGREQNGGAAIAPSQFDLQAYVDGEYLGRQTLTADDITYAQVHYYTPWLLPGTHTIRIFWDNAASQTSLRIQSLQLETLGGPVGTNGVYSWVNTRLQPVCGLDVTQPTNSYVSPVSLEGRDGFLSMMSISATDPSAGTTTNVAPEHNAGYVLYAADTTVPPHTGERWYANVPLSPTTGTVVAASFQNGGLIQTNTITWTPVNVLSGGNMTIRQGDSLLLTTLPGGTNDPGTISISIGGNSYPSTNGAPVQYQFTQTGTNAVTGIFSGNDGTQQTNSINVVVVGFSFSSNPDCWQESTREWDNTNVASQIAFQADPRILEYTETGAISNNGVSYNVLIDANENRSVMARLGSQGPILGAAQAGGFQFYGAPQTYNYVMEIYPDGSMLVQTLLVLSPVPSDISAQVEIVVAGVTFEDGSTSQTLTASDFDALGQAQLSFIMPSNTPANCHIVNLYQGGVFLGTY